MSSAAPPAMVIEAAQQATPHQPETLRMDKHSLRELDEYESHRTQQLATGLRERLMQGHSISERDMYPELGLTEPYTYCIGTVKPIELLPWFNTVLVDLRPLPSAAAFQARYGLGIADFVRYIEQGRIAIRLRAQYVDFAGLDYLRDLVLGHPRPPSSRRYISLHNDAYQDNLDKGRALAARHLPRVSTWRQEYEDWKQPPPFREVFAGKFALVSIYFGADHAEEIVTRGLRASGDIGLAYNWLHIFSRFRVYPFMNALDGLTTLPIADAAVLPSFLRHELVGDQTIPYEVGRAIALNLPITLPDDLDKAVRAGAKSWLEAIVALDKALELGGASDIESRCAELHQLALLTRDSVQKMSDRQAKIERAIVTISGIGILGALSQYAPIQWRPIIGTAAAALYQMRTRIAEATVKLRKRSHVIAWFRLQRKVGKM